MLDLLCIVVSDLNDLIRLGKMKVIVRWVDIVGEGLWDAIDQHHKVDPLLKMLWISTITFGVVPTRLLIDLTIF